jgi:hypothetical protein
MAAVAVVGFIIVGSLLQSGRPEQGVSTRPEPRGTITEAAFGEDWPFVFSSGVLRCEGSGGSGMVTFEAYNGVTYAVNGWAKGQAARRGWNDDVFSIVKDGGNVGPIIQRGLQDCR